MMGQINHILSNAHHVQPNGERRFRSLWEKTDKAVGYNGQAHRPRRRRRKQFRGGQRLAIARAIAAGRAYLAGTFTTQTEAATAHGTNLVYIRAVITLLRAEAGSQLRHALLGHASLLRLAREFKVTSVIVSACRRATAFDLEISGRTLGPAMVWDSMIVPNV
jgi:hypothetical protein